jgi:hypothetical protein
MYKTKIPGPERIEAGMSVLKRCVPLFIKWIPGPDKFRAHEYRRGSAEKVFLLQENKPADLPARHVWTRIGQTAERGVVALQFISGDKTNLRMRFGQFHHAPEAIGKDPIVRLHHFAILAIVRDVRKREVVVSYLGKK